MPEDTGQTGLQNGRVVAFLKTIGPVLLVFALFAAGTYALYRLLEPVNIRDVFEQARSVPTQHLVAAFAATFAGYLALIGYDWSALKYLGRKIPLPVIMVGGFLGYSFGNTIGVSAISGGAVRFRIYSAFGLNAFEIAAISTFVSLAFGIGIVIIGLTALALHPYALGEMISWPPGEIRLLAAGTAILSVGVMTWLSVTGKSLKIRSFEIPAPSVGILFGQLLFTLADTSMAALTLYVLMPDSAPDFITFLAIFAAASMLGVLSHVPGGVGVFETVIIATLPAGVPVEHAAAALLLYRIIFYLVPFALAMVFVALNEARLASGLAARFMGDVSEQMLPVMRAISSIAPAVAGTASLGLGIWMLLMAVLPAARPSEIDPGDVLIAVVLEGGALLLAALGTIVILLALGLFRRISGAFWLTLAAFGAGIVASILNEVDTDTALVLAVAIMVLLPLKREFYRSAKLTHNVLSPEWFALVSGIALCAAALLILTHEATPYSNGLWITFSADALTPRALRAGLLASAVMMFFLILLALRPARLKGAEPTVDVMALAAEVIKTGSNPSANLALTGDKSLFFSDRKDAFIMYAEQGKSWVVLGDPVGPATSMRDLAWAFGDAAYAANARPVFYEVSEKYLSLWVEMGLTLQKIGEEAVINLPAFSLAGGRFKNLRSVQNKSLKQGQRLEVLHPPHSAALLEDLKRVSDAWLGLKNTQEKRFSVGRFNEEYLQRFPLALVRRDGRIIAFANLLQAPTEKSASIDLMRYVPAEGDGIMDFLFVELILYWRDAGYKTFSLGMAPLSGITAKHGSRLWSRFGALLFRHGGAFYNFEGLRAFKQKFAPEWKPRFIAVPGNLLPLPALKDVALLIAGGTKGLISK